MAGPINSLRHRPVRDAHGPSRFARSDPAETLASILRDSHLDRPDQPVGAPAPSMDPRSVPAKDPNDRYASTSDLAKDLAALRNRLLEAPVVNAPKARVAAQTGRRSSVIDRAGRRAIAAAPRGRAAGHVDGRRGAERRGALSSPPRSALVSGAYTVPLAAIADPGLVAASIMLAVGGPRRRPSRSTEVVKRCSPPPVNRSSCSTTSRGARRGTAPGRPARSCELLKLS
jgi:hypothetical protein